MERLVNILELMPPMCATGISADVMKRLTAPEVGGVDLTMLLVLFVISIWHKDVWLLAGKS